MDAESPRALPVSYSSKARLLAGAGLSFSDEPKPLLAAFLLEPRAAKAISLRPLSGLERYMGWLRNSFLLDIEDHDLLAQHFDWTHRISAAVPTFSLDYPRDYGILPKVRIAVERHLKDHVL